MSHPCQNLPVQYQDQCRDDAHNVCNSEQVVNDGKVEECKNALASCLGNVKTESDIGKCLGDLSKQYLNP